MNPQQWQNDINHFMSICAFEDIYASQNDLELFKLLSEGKISKAKFLEICLEQAKPSIQ